MTIDELIQAAEADGWKYALSERFGMSYFVREGRTLTYDAQTWVCRWWIGDFAAATRVEHAVMNRDEVLAKLRELEGRTV